MAGPSNIRVNPFTGTGGATNYIELTEKHIIPAVSPYVIRLNEVPEKQDPSNMKMVYVDSATGAASETALTEVAATPGQGEFRPDYSTNALEDKTWNTGLIEFSASDAGKIVQVTYTGTGTLAGVNSNHWPSWYTDRGDGSDGDFVPTENTTISGVKNYKSVFIKEGITVTVEKYGRIKCQGAFINNGTVNVTQNANTNIFVVDDIIVSGVSATSYPTVISVGGAGGNAYSERVAYSVGASPFIRTDSIQSIIYMSEQVFIGGNGGNGSLNGAAKSGGEGGGGGGCIIITSASFSNNAISANGADGNKAGNNFGGGGGAGGGGCILVVTGTLLKAGTNSVNGGKGGKGGYDRDNGADGGAGIAIVKEIGV